MFVSENSGVFGVVGTKGEAPWFAAGGIGVTLWRRWTH